MLKLVGARPFHKTASGRKRARKLAAFSSLVESEAQLDVILDNDLKLRGNPILKAEVKKQILAMNPKLTAPIEGASDGERLDTEP
jgi:hypothetical protein